MKNLLTGDCFELTEDIQMKTTHLLKTL